MERKTIKIDDQAHQAQTFEIEEYDDHVKIIEFLSRENQKVDIPESIYGKQITAIGDNCFFNCYRLKEVLFSSKIESIGAQAFALCKGLTELILPDSVIEIGHHAFRDCRGLKKVVLPKNLKRLPVGLFSFCYLLDPKIVLPDGLEVIESGAFWSAGEFDLLIPESVREIGVGAFNRGPHPITNLPEDKGWYLQWPYGESVTCPEGYGKVTDLHYLEDNCMLHEVTLDNEIKYFVYPGDYLEDRISFLEERNMQRMQNDIRNNWDTEEKKEAALKVRDAWLRGLIEKK